MKKLLAADVDDISLDFIGDLNIHLGLDREYEPTGWNYPELNVPADAIQKYIQSGPMHTAFQEMVRFLNEAREQHGWELVLITAHPANKMMERIRNLNQIGLRYDHIVFTAFHGPDGKSMGVSKAQYLKEAYSHRFDHIVLIDDRLKSVNEFTQMGLGLGASVVRAYNSEDLKILQEDRLSAKRTVLGVGETRKAQLLDMIDKLKTVMASVDGVARIK
jgi:hypothetical protein